MIAIMGIMVALMVIGFLGFSHHGITRAHDNGDKKESVMLDQEKETQCPDCPADPKAGKSNTGDKVEGK